MRIVIFHLFFLLCIGCSNSFQEKAILINKEIENTSILSTKFDSLIQNINQLPLSYRIDCFLKLSYRVENSDGILKQEKLLQDIFPLTFKKKRKEILLRLVVIYNNQDRHLLTQSSLKGIQCIEQLEREYSLTQEEKWSLSKAKADFLNQQGKQEEYLPIWFKLLKEHRIANNTQLIIEDLCTIASHFDKLRDNEKAIVLYKEAYQLSIDKNYPKFTNRCLLPLVELLLNNKQYKEIIEYYRNIKQNSVLPSHSSIYNTLIECYLRINKPDSARIILKQRLLVTNQDNILFNRQMAETYILEEKEDSASIYLEKALQAFFSNNKRYQNKNAETSLPVNFLQTYSMYAELLQKNGKTQLAGKAYKFIEPLVDSDVEGLNWLEKQIKAITSYSTFCRTTKQYEKALDLLAHRDSLQHIYNARKEEQDKNNLIHRFEVGELTHKLEMQDTELKHSKTLNYFLILSGLVVAIFIIMISLLFRNYRKQNKKLYQQQEQLQEMEEKIGNNQEETNKALFLKAEKKVKSDKLFLKKDFSIDTLSNKLKTNRTYLSVSINEHTGKSYITWINDLRINYAIKLMREDTTIDTRKLATQCGFASNDTFYKNFKQRYGVIPNQYLAQIILEQEGANGGIKNKD